MKRRNLIGSLLAGAGVLFARSPLAATPQSDADSSLPATGAPNTATVRVIYANASQASWEAVTNGGILVAGATNVTPGNAAAANMNIVHDAVKAIIAAGGPTLTRQQVALFGGQN